MTTQSECLKLTAGEKPYRELSEEIHQAFADGAGCIEIADVQGQRYIGCGLSGQGRIILHGTPGNDLAAFMNGPEIIVYGNGQDVVGNTMNKGRVIVHGEVGDVVGHSMRGGTILISGSVGYRAGIHMKSYQDKRAVLVVGGAAGDYLGEYMAGGLLIVLGLGRQPGQPISGIYTGTGMHGGKMILGDEVNDYRLGREVGKSDLDAADRVELRQYVDQYVEAFGGNADQIMNRPFCKLLPVSRRPYGQIYVY